MITQSELKNHIHYNPKTGIFTRKIRTSRNTRVGDIAGFKKNSGYLSFQLNRKENLAHRMAFLYMTGEMPKQVDHINHVRDDNRWCNLRAANNRLNSRNHGRSKANTSGFTGVSWNTCVNKWCAEIWVNYKKIYLGSYKVKKDAIKARKEANKSYGFHENHGRNISNEIVREAV